MEDARCSRRRTLAAETGCSVHRACRPNIHWHRVDTVTTWFCLSLNPTTQRPHNAIHNHCLFTETLTLCLSLEISGKKFRIFLVIFSVIFNHYIARSNNNGINYTLLAFESYLLHFLSFNISANGKWSVRSVFSVWTWSLFFDDLVYSYRKKQRKKLHEWEFPGCRQYFGNFRKIPGNIKFSQNFQFCPDRFSFITRQTQWWSMPNVTLDRTALPMGLRVIMIWF